MDSEPRTRIAAEDYLEALAAHGIDHLFCNPGTDFAPIVEAFARAAHTNRKVPRPMVVPHENAALSMAHGYTMITGRAAGGDAAHQRWHGELDQHADRCEPRPHAGAADLGAHAVHRNGRRGLAQCAHPLGAGDVRPGRHAARDGEVGLRDEARRPGRDRGRSRAGTGDGFAERSGLSLAAARGAGRGDADAGGEQSRASRRTARTGAVARRHRSTRRLDRRGACACRDHRSTRSGPARRSGAGAAGGALGVAGDPVQHTLLRDVREPSDVPGLDARSAAGGCRSGDRDRVRCAVAAEQGSAAGRRTHRADRRGSTVTRAIRCAVSPPT